MQSKAVEFEAIAQEDRDWLETDLSHLSELEPYDWGDTDPQTIGSPISYEPNIGFVIEGGRKNGE